MNYLETNMFKYVSEKEIEIMLKKALPLTKFESIDKISSDIGETAFIAKYFDENNQLQEFLVTQFGIFHNNQLTTLCIPELYQLLLSRISDKDASSFENNFFKTLESNLNLQLMINHDKSLDELNQKYKSDKKQLIAEYNDMLKFIKTFIKDSKSQVHEANNSNNENGKM